MAGLLAQLSNLLAPAKEWPEFESAVGTLSAEMPQEVAAMKDRRIRPMGVVEKLLYAALRPGVAATTTPFGNITYDRELIEKAGVNPEDVLAHELVHVRQLERDGGPIQSLARLFKTNASTPYAQRDYEREALEHELSKAGQRKRTGDIRLGARKK